MLLIIYKEVRLFLTLMFILNKNIKHRNGKSDRTYTHYHITMTQNYLANKLFIYSCFTKIIKHCFSDSLLCTICLIDYLTHIILHVCIRHKESIASNLVQFNLYKTVNKTLTPYSFICIYHTGTILPVICNQVQSDLYSTANCKYSLNNQI